MRYFGKEVKYSILFIPIILLLVIAVPAMAISYYANILVQETSGTNHGTIGLIEDMGLSFMASQGFINSDGRDVQVALGGTETKRMLADNYLLFTDNVTAYQSDYYTLSTNNTAEDFSIITGYGGKITTADNSSLEPSGSFSANFTNIYLNTDSGTSKNILTKGTNLSLNVDSSTSGKINLTSTNGSFDFTTYTKVDASGNITSTTSSNFTVTSAACNSDLYAYKDYGASYFNSINSTFEIYTSNATLTAGSGANGIAYSNNLDDITGFAATDIAVASSSNTSTQVVIYLLRGNFTSYDQCTILNPNQTYYCRLVRAVGSDVATCYIYATSSMVTPVDTLTLNGIGVGTLWRYQFGMVNDNSGVAGAKWTGSVANLADTTYYLNNSTSLTGITTGEHDIIAGLNSPFLYLSTDTSTINYPVTTNLTFNAPLWQTECSSSPFTSIDSNGASVAVNGATWTTSGYSFDGLNDYLQATDAAYFDISSNITIEAWVYLDAVGKFHTIVSKGVDRAYNLRIRDTNFLQFYVIRSDGVTLDAVTDDTHALAVSQWYHVVATASVGQPMKLYLNGSLIKSGDNFVDIETNATDVFIGTRSDLWAAGFLQGKLGEVRIYNNGFTQTQVTQNYNSTKLKYLGTGTTSVYSTLASIPDNSSNFTFIDGTTTPFVSYVDSIRYSVSGVEQLLYLPNAIVLGAVYSTGNVTATHNSNNVTGFGTIWTSDMVGSSFLTADGNMYKVATVTSNTTLTLDTNYLGASITFPTHTYNMYATLPNRGTFGAYGNGGITWASNPSGVNVQTGYLQFDESTVTGQKVGTPDSVDVLNAPDNMSIPDSDMKMTYNIFYFMVNWLSGVTDIDVVMIWWWISAALSIATLVLIRRFLNSIWAAGILSAIVSGAFVAMGMNIGSAGALEFWNPIVIVIATAFVGVWLRTSEAG